MLNPGPTLDQLLQSGIQHHQSGRLPQAEAAYREILRRNPRHAEALHLLGVIAHQVGRHQAAADLIRQAVALRPNYPQAYSNLGDALKDLGQFDDAVAACRQAIALQPNFPAPWNNLGNALRGKGRLDDAIAACRQAISLKGDYSQAYSNLGNALYDQHKVDEAIAAYRHALALQPDFPDAQNNLGVALKEKRQFDEAIAAFRQAIALKPDFPDAHNNLGISLKETGRLDEAAASFRRAISLKPDYSQAHANLGIAFYDQGRMNEAIAAFRQALALQSDFPQAHFNLANALYHQRQVDAAITAYRRAIALDPDYADAWSNLANALNDRGQIDDAIAAARHAIALNPDLPEAHNNLGMALKDKGDLDAAIAAHRQAIALRPDYPEGYNNLGNARKDQGRLDDAIAAFRHAITLNPQFTDGHGNLVYAMHFHPAYDAQKIADELHCWNRRHAHPLPSLSHLHSNDRDPQRPLRIGYVSPDFRDHVVGLSLLPLIREHNRQQFHVTCYGNVPRPDAMTDQFRKLADNWRDISALSDEQAAGLILNDAIDILVDTTLHMAANRLLLFARRPAPVQVTFSGYPGTTGLDAIDYRLTDPWLDPPAASEQNAATYTEQSIRLADSFWCYDPRTNEPAVGPLPALSERGESNGPALRLSNGPAHGTITFGCLNNFCKVNDQVLALWARVMREVAGSRLLLLTPRGSARDHVLEILAAEGISMSRVDFVSAQPRRLYLQTYHQIDICLDTFPYNGHWTSLDALWMGVPVVSLMGKTTVGRGGLSILSNLRLPELVAATPEQYVQVATELANNLPRLASLRSTLRKRMEHSPLMDAPRFARNIESAYRQMWGKFVAHQ